MFTSLVKEQMEKAGLSVQALASQTGLSTNTIMRARGPLIARCTLETLAAIAGALEVKAKELFEEN
jgi:transcriptional regulator with XRE-family HTH domain